LKAIDVAFDGVAGAKDLKGQIGAGVALGKAIKTWVDLKQGDSRRLAMVSTLREQVTAQVAAWELKDLTDKANEFKARFAGKPGNDLEAEKAYLDQLVDDLSGIAKSPAFHDAKSVQLAVALQKAASAKFQELVDLTELQEFQAARQPLLDGPILSAPTRELIKRLATAGKSLEATELVDALFEDFCAYGRAHLEIRYESEQGQQPVGRGKNRRLWHLPDSIRETRQHYRREENRFLCRGHRPEFHHRTAKDGSIH